MPLLPADISALYRAHARGMVAFFVRRTFDGEAAVDLTAETFAVAFEQRDRFHGRPESDGVRWIYGIARNQLLRFYRDGRVEQRAIARLGVERRELTDHEYERIEELASIDVLRQRVVHEMAALPQKHAEVLQMRVLDELGYDEIARRLAINEATARARVSRSLKTLAERLAPYLPAEEVSNA